MPHPICHAHCPDSGGGLGLVAGAAVVAVVGYAAVQVVASMLPAILIAGVALLAAACAGFAWVWHREHAHLRVPARAQERRALRATRSPVALPVRRPLAITGRQVHVITDAGPSRVRQQATGG